MAAKVSSHRDLDVYRKAYSTAMRVFRLSKAFPKEETYSLTDQIRRSSRSVNANLTEAWRKRRYENAFVSKLSDAETEAAETQTWLEFAVSYGYCTRELGKTLFEAYEEILRMIVAMIANSEKWVFPDRKRMARG